MATVAGGGVTNVYVYDLAGDLVAEYGGGVSQNGTRYVMGDGQGSTRLVTDGAGGVVARQDYLPFGEEVPGAVGMRAGVAGYGQGLGTRQKYAGMEGDEATGLSHTPWREYDSLSARWTAPDPYPGSMELSSPQSFNRYTYCNNDPVNKVDPTGLMLSDIGVVQTDNPAAARRMESAMGTLLRRYVEVITGRVQQRQTATQRANAAFVSGMVMGAMNNMPFDRGSEGADAAEQQGSNAATNGNVNSEPSFTGNGNSASNTSYSGPRRRDVSLTFDISSGVLKVFSGRRSSQPIYSFAAQSGRNGVTLNNPDYVAVQDMGPIPPGNYHIFVSEINQPNTLGAIYRNRPKPIGGADWGSFLVAIHPDAGTNTFGRRGFFLHGGLLPGSAGCIDVGGGILGDDRTRRLLIYLRSDRDGRVPLRVTP